MQRAAGGSQSVAQTSAAEAAAQAELQCKAKNFPFKLNTMLQESPPQIFGWLSHGFAFAIFDATAFIEYVLPRYFAHQNMASFGRQLNLYGFRKVAYGRDRGAYFHPDVSRDKPDSVLSIRRTPVKKGVASLFSSSLVTYDEILKSHGLENAPWCADPDDKVGLSAFIDSSPSSQPPLAKRQRSVSDHGQVVATGVKVKTMGPKSPEPRLTTSFESQTSLDTVLAASCDMEHRASLDTVTWLPPGMPLRQPGTKRSASMDAGLNVGTPPRMHRHKRGNSDAALTLQAYKTLIGHAHQERASPLFVEADGKMSDDGPARSAQGQGGTDWVNRRLEIVRQMQERVRDMQTVLDIQEDGLSSLLTRAEIEGPCDEQLELMLQAEALESALQSQDFESLLQDLSPEPMLRGQEQEQSQEQAEGQTRLGQREDEQEFCLGTTSFAAAAALVSRQWPFTA